jgi:Ni/Fe-hydrogenase subunit HybB-like protein
MKEQNSKSPHILNTSATLMGLCFIVLTSMKMNNRMEKTVIDELTALAILMFMVSCFLSFQSIRTSSKSSEGYEKYADIVFLTGLFFLLVITALIIFDIF